MSKFQLSLIAAAVMWFAGCAAPEKPIRTAAESLAELQAGCGRFAAGNCRHPHCDASRRHETAIHGQHPHAAIVSCSDSRVPVEIIFDQGLGDLFVIRVAGNVIADDESGTIEYAVEHLHLPLVVVMGHERCGAVTAVVEGAHEEGNLSRLIAHIAPAVSRAREDHPEAAGETLVTYAVEENVRHGIEDLLIHSHTIREAIDRGSLEVVGAVYDIDTAQVRWLGRHPREAELLRATGDSWNNDDEGRRPSAASHVR